MEKIINYLKRIGYKKGFQRLYLTIVVIWWLIIFSTLLTSDDLINVEWGWALFGVAVLPVLIYVAIIIILRTIKWITDGFKPSNVNKS